MSKVNLLSNLRKPKVVLYAAVAGLPVFAGLFAGHACADIEDDFDLNPATAELDNPGNYSLAAVPNSPNDLTFTNGTYSPTVFTLNSTPLTPASINDLNASQTLTINGTKSFTLEGGSNSFAPSTADLLYVASGGTLNISAPVVLTVAGNFDIAGTASINGPISDAGLGFNQTGTGTLTLASSTSNYTGATTIKSGTLVAGNSDGVTGINSSSAVYLGDTSGSSSATLQLGSRSSTTYNNNITVQSGNSGLMTLSSSGYTALNGTVTLGTANSNGQSLTLAEVGNPNWIFNVNGLIQDPTGLNSGTAGSVNIGSGNVGTVQFNGNNTYTGSTTINAGTLIAGNSGGVTGINNSAVYLGDTAGSSPATLQLGSSSSTTYNNNITVQSGSSGVMTLSASGYIWLNGNITLGTANSNGQSLTFAEVGQPGWIFYVNGIIQDPTGLNYLTAGSVTIGSNNNGTVEFNGNNTYTGSTTINAGTLIAGNSGGVTGINNSAVYLGDTAGSSPATLQLGSSSSTTYNNNITVQSGSSGVMTLSASGYIWLNGNITLGTANSNGQSLTFAEVGQPSWIFYVNGLIQDPTGLNYLTAGSVTIGSNNNGTVEFNGNNTYTGPTTIAAGTLVAGNSDGVTGIGSSSAVYLGDTSGSSPATLQLGNRSSTTYTNNITVQSGNTGLMTLSASGYDTLNGTITLGTAYSNGQSLTIAEVGDPNWIFYVNGVIQDPTGLNYLTAGTVTIGSSNIGTVELSNANTYSGGTTLSSGTLLLGASSTVTGSTVTSGPVGTGTLTLSGGTLTNNPPVTVANAIAVTASTTTNVVAGNNGDMTLTGTITGSGTFQNSSSVAGSVLMQGDISNFRGTFSFTDFSVGNNFNFNGPSAASQNGSGAMFVLSGDITGPRSLSIGSGSATTFQMGELSGTGGIIQPNVDSVTLQIGALNTSPGAFAGIITGTLSLNKVGTGTLTLTGANSYSGPTTVSVGTLSIMAPGSLGNTSVTVAGTLGGNGTIGNTGSNVVSISSGGTIAPGTPSTFGTLTTGSQAWNSGGIYAWKTSQDLSSSSSGSLSTSGVAGNQDFLEINGGTLAISPGFILDILQPGSPAPSGVPSTFIIANVANGGSITVNGVTQSAGYTLPAGEFTVTDVSNGGENYDYAASLVSDPNGGTDVEVTVPEPGSLGVLAIAALGLLRRRRSSRGSG